MRSTTEPRRTLTVRNPQVEPLVRDINVAGPDRDDVRAFALRIVRERNDWSVRNGGALHHRRISRTEAERELRRALAAAAAGGAK
ncbi:MAG TPA: hypothetical protein VJM34_06915 [Novosphingobium sp.]|nr:hypothetical protein [Novosphingobium sp.]